MGTEYLFISPQRAVDLIWELAKKVKSNFKPDCLVGISRGGLWVVRNVSDLLGVREVYIVRIIHYTGIKTTENEPRLSQDVDENSVKGKKILLIDDVADTGGSLIFAVKLLKEKKAKEIKIATLHYKPWSKLKPDFYIEETSKWIVYPWEFREVFESIMKKEEMTEDEKMEELKKTGIPENLVQEFLEADK